MSAFRTPVDIRAKNSRLPSGQRAGHF